MPNARIDLGPTATAPCHSELHRTPRIRAHAMLPHSKGRVPRGDRVLPRRDVLDDEGPVLSGDGPIRAVGGVDPALHEVVRVAFQPHDVAEPGTKLLNNDFLRRGLPQIEQGPPRPVYDLVSVNVV